MEHVIKATNEKQAAINSCRAKGIQVFWERVVVRDWVPRVTSSIILLNEWNSWFGTRDFAESTESVDAVFCTCHGEPARQYRRPSATQVPS